MSLASKNIKKLIVSLFFCLATVSLFFVACSVRERDNVFDPQNKLDSLDIPLTLTTADSLISFYWNPPSGIEFTGFHIYRKVSGQNHFTSRAVLPPTQSSFTDTSLSFDVLHSYYLTLIGRSLESPPTRVLNTVPGPGKIWLLDRWDEYFYKYSYGLRHRLLTHYAIWIPEGLALNRSDRQVLVTYPLFHYAELLDSESGALLAAIENIRYPYACAYHPAQKAFWITDSTGSLYRFSASGSQEAELIDDGLKKPLTIVIDASGNVYVLDFRLNRIVIYDQNGNQTNVIDDYERLIFLAGNQGGTHLYFINQSQTGNEVYRYSVLSGDAEKVYSGQGAAIVRENPQDQALWLAENMDNVARILQLSPSGVRLTTLDGFKHIEDIAINPYNGNVVVADSRLHQLIHLKPDGRVIGKISDAPFPYRIVIE
ncbi:NHL repeat containing protein [Caldithrix abyssi DSM 13497]|uniref:NHL repeat containing protein n=1 Tax=Caldithrix abyssi DSM 13497 TaxID=880073 RepID=H1XTN3_CALAY|nr:NHL repeat containing protein [Caldithrix abyssi DSM 13497]